MPVPHRSPKGLLRALLSLSAILALSIPLLLTACGGKAGTAGGSTGGSGTSTPTPGAAQGKWTWMSGSSTVGTNAGQPGIYGALGTASASNVPGGRNSSVSWTDSSGNLWLFGGYGDDLIGMSGQLNDLWEFNPSTKEWTWMSGSSTVGAFGQPGVYGTMDTADSHNVPGGRAASVSWTDSSGNLWLFGGLGNDSIGAMGSLNDLWEFNPTTKEWTWMSGSNTAHAPGVYGTKGTAAASNVPGGRFYSVSWIDSSGNFWLFGGDGHDSTGARGFLNDLWEFSPATKEWTWVSGSSTANASGVYGTLGVPSTTNIPGGRAASVSWIDSSGNLWLFGGEDYDSTTGAYGGFNDLWEFSPATKEWTWVSGSNVVNASGVYGTQGVAASSNIPGERILAVSWTDGIGNLWLFGGYGADSTSGILGGLNDLWEFNPATKEWTWMGGGSNTADAPGIYGTLGTAAPNNVPGGRGGAVSWTDSSGNLWLFGGYGADSTGMQGNLNDLWSYQP